MHRLFMKTRQEHTRSENTYYGLRESHSPDSELVGRYGGLTLADLSAPVIALFHTKYQKSDIGCWPWLAGKYASGYGMVYLRRDENRKQINNYAHRVAYVLSKGPVPPGYVVRHRCDNPSCVNPDHLLLGTQGDNNRDTAQRRRTPKTRPWLWKLSDGDVNAIRMSFATHEAMAQAYGVSKTTISFIRRGLRRKAA